MHTALIVNIATAVVLWISVQYFLQGLQRADLQRTMMHNVLYNLFWVDSGRPEMVIQRWWQLGAIVFLWHVPAPAHYGRRCSKQRFGLHAHWSGVKLQCRRPQCVFHSVRTDCLSAASSDDKCYHTQQPKSCLWAVCWLLCRYAYLLVLYSICPGHHKQAYLLKYVI